MVVRRIVIIRNILAAFLPRFANSYFIAAASLKLCTHSPFISIT